MFEGAENLIQVALLVISVVGGALALIEYRKGLSLKAAEILLEVEAEFREVAPTFDLMEDEDRYDQVLRPVLLKSLANYALPEGATRDEQENAKKKRYTCVNAPADEAPPLTDLQFATQKELDRALRFLYLCAVLHADLRAERGALARAYYQWLRTIMNPTDRPELACYVARYFPRTLEWLVESHEWIREHVPTDPLPNEIENYRLQKGPRPIRCPFHPFESEIGSPPSHAPSAE